MSSGPSRRHEFLAWAVPRLRKSRELDDRESERARIERWHRTLDRTFPTRLVPRFDRRFTLSTEDAGGFPSYVMTPRARPVTRTVFFVHGGGFMAPADPFHVRYAARLAEALDARVVVPDYPLTPEHTWRDSFEQLLVLAGQACREPGETVFLGDSAGGGYVLALTIALRDRGLPLPARMLLLAPWVDLSLSTREETELVAAGDPWLFLGKMEAYAEWWAGSPDELARPEVSPALADLTGLPPTLVFAGTRDACWPGVKLLVRRGRDAGWPLHYVEAPDLLHVFPLLPLIPEARRAWRTTLEFLA